MGGSDVDVSGSEYGPLAGPGERDNEAEIP